MKKLLFALPLLAALNSFALAPVREYAVQPSDYGMDYKESWIKHRGWRKTLRLGFQTKPHL